MLLRRAPTLGSLSAKLCHVWCCQDCGHVWLTAFGNRSLRCPCGNSEHRSKTDANGKLRGCVPKLTLFEIDDAERFCSAIASKCGSSLSWSDREDLEQYLLVECWLLSLTYKPGAASFSSYANGKLRLRVVDWQRQRNGRKRWVFRDRVYERPRPTFVSLDDDAERDRLEQTLAPPASDSSADCDPALAGLHADRDRQRARDYHELGLEAPRRAAG
jgi:hypothetical protein